MSKKTPLFWFLKNIVLNRKIVIARELTKIHEEFIRGTIQEIIERSENLKGEFVIIIDGNKEKEDNKNELNNLSLEKHYSFYEKQGY